MSVSARSVRAGFEQARKVADAVLYGRYVLYPYRASAAKNQIRWQFGVIAPRRHCEAEGGERWSLRTEVLVEGARPVVDLKLRFLRVQSRTVQDASGAPVASIEVDGKLWTSWDEAVEEELDVEALGLGERVIPFELEPVRVVEDLGSAGRVVRECRPVSAELRACAERLAGPYPLVRFRVEVANVTPWSEAGARRDDVMRRSLAAVHTLLAVHHGKFLSLVDPPEFAAGAVAKCVNEGTWPVLVGEDGGPTVVLSSPITLYALALRVSTLTDEEKRQARGTDDRAAAIIDRVDAMPPELFDKLQGAVRYLPAVTHGAGGAGALHPTWDPGEDASVDPWQDTVWVGSHDVGRGTRVRLRPTGRADAHDMFLVGKTATVEGVFLDGDGETHLAVTLDDDPGAEMARTHGRYLYFRPEELEVMDPG